jgi:PTS system galactitol-specific IIA component
MTWTSAALIINPMSAKDSTDAITQLGKLLVKEKYVKDTFIQAVIEREKVFATGLPTPETQVAIPHTDPEHVHKTGIAVGVLPDPVSFGEMGNPDSKVSVNIVCVLAVKEADFLVSLLQELVAIFQDAEILNQIVTASSTGEVAEIFNHRLPQYQEE